MSGTTLRVVLAVLADMLAVAGGVAVWLQTGEILWVIVGALMGGMITLVFLLPALKAAAAEKESARVG